MRSSSVSKSIRGQFKKKGDSVVKKTEKMQHRRSLKEKWDHDQSPTAIFYRSATILIPLKIWRVIYQTMTSGAAQHTKKKQLHLSRRAPSFLLHTHTQENYQLETVSTPQTSFLNFSLLILKIS